MKKGKYLELQKLNEVQASQLYWTKHIEIREVMVIYMRHSLLTSLRGLLSMCLCVCDMKRDKIHKEEFPQNDAAKQKMYLEYIWCMYRHDDRDANPQAPEGKPPPSVWIFVLKLVCPSSRLLTPLTVTPQRVTEGMQLHQSCYSSDPSHTLSISLHPHTFSFLLWKLGLSYCMYENLSACGL